MTATCPTCKATVNPPAKPTYTHPQDPAMSPVIERAMREVLEDIAAGRVPADVPDFSALHDYVDANEYGGACETDPDVPFDGFTEEQVDFWNKVQGHVDLWLKAGRPAVTPYQPELR